MMLMTIERPEGKHYEVLGLVQGSTIQSKNVGHDITQGLKTIVGGELKAYTDMMNQARDIAAERHGSAGGRSGSRRRDCDALYDSFCAAGCC